VYLPLLPLGDGENGSVRRIQQELVESTVFVMDIDEEEEAKSFSYLSNQDLDEGDHQETKV